MNLIIFALKIEKLSNFLRPVSRLLWQMNKIVFKKAMVCVKKGYVISNFSSIKLSVCAETSIKDIGDIHFTRPYRNSKVFCTNVDFKGTTNSAPERIFSLVYHLLLFLRQDICCIEKIQIFL